MGIARDIGQRALETAMFDDSPVRTPVMPLTPGDAWDGFSFRGIPLVPNAAPLTSVATATRPIDVYRLSDQLVAPAHGAVLSRQRRIIAASIKERLVFLSAGRVDWLRLVTKIRPSSVSGTTTVLTPGRRQYFHLYADVVPRVCAFGLPGLADTKVDILHHGPLGPAMQFLMDRLKPANVTFRALDSPDLVRAEELVLPTFPVWNFSGWLPNWFVTQLREALLPDRPSRRSERFVIIRRGSRKLLNQEELLGRLRPHGFRPVVLEELSFEEQIQLFHDAEAIVATHGAGLTNLLFSTDALVVELFPTPTVYPHFLLMAASLGHHHRYVLGAGASKDADYVTDIRAVEHEVVAGLQALA